MKIKFPTGTFKVDLGIKNGGCKLCKTKLEYVEKVGHISPADF
jgi:hypothetical protein